MGCILDNGRNGYLLWYEKLMVLKSRERSQAVVDEENKSSVLWGRARIFDEILSNSPSQPCSANSRPGRGEAGVSSCQRQQRKNTAKVYRCYLLYLLSISFYLLHFNFNIYRSLGWC